MSRCNLMIPRPACVQPICVKITDFGMSVDDRSTGHVDEASTEGRRHESVNHVIAVRWAPPEILAAASASVAPWSEKSDVWSFGVTVWQLYSCGEVPYTLSMSDTSVKQHVLASCLLPAPQACPKEMCTFMHMCWRFKAADRASFSGLKTVLNSMLL